MDIPTLIRTERLLPGALSSAAPVRGIIDTVIAVACHDMLMQSPIYREGPSGCTITLDDCDVREYAPGFWGLGDPIYLERAEKASREVADRLSRKLHGCRVRAEGRNVVVRYVL